MMKASQALAALGDTATAVTRTLQGLGIRELKDTTDLCTQCPVARYLKLKCGVTYSVNQFSCRRECDCGDRTELPLPVSQFVMDYSNARHPLRRPRP